MTTEGSTDARPPTSLWQRALLWLITMLCCAWLYTRIDAVAARQSLTLDSFAAADVSDDGASRHDGASMKELPQGQVRIEALDDDLIMHTYQSKGFESGSGSVTTFVFESGDNLLVFDTQFYKPFAEEAKAYIESLGKPVDKLIISHGHPDHGFGYAYMKDLGELWGTANVIEESRQSFPFYAEILKQRMADEAADIMPLDDLPIATATLELGEYDFDGTTFEFFEMPTQEAGTEMFVIIPEHKLLMVFDAIIPDGHELVIGAGMEALPEQIGKGMAMLDALEADERFDRIVFGHGIEPKGREQLALARESLEIYAEIAPEAASAEEFIRMAAARKPDWKDRYLQMTAGSLYR